MNRRAYLIHSVLVPLAVSVAAGVVLFGGGRALGVLDDVPWWATAVAAAAFTIALALLLRRSIRRRYFALKVAEEVSSARCGDYFVRLAELTFAEISAPAEALERLGRVVEVRRYPNRRFYDDLVSVVDSGSRKDASDRALDYLRLARHTRSLTREGVIQRFSDYARDLSEPTLIVLYGYSSTICAGLAHCGRSLRTPVFLVEDMQYGDVSLGEHRHAQQHLQEAGIEPIVIPFNEISTLLSPSARFVPKSAGGTAPVSRARRVVALLGCEAMSLRGDVLIPSKIRNTFSETALFVEVFHEAAQSESGKAEVVVVSESYKIHDDLDGEQTVSHAPFRARAWRRLLYLATGLGGLPHGPEVELVRLGSAEVGIVVDDAGVHPPSATGRVETVWRQWRAATLRHVLPEAPPVDLDTLLSRSRTAVFDLNGVLMDDEPAHYAAFGELVRQRGATLTHEEYLRFCCGRTDREGVEALVDSKGLQGDVDDLVEVKRRAYRRYRGENSLAPFRGAVDFARSLAGRGVRCYLVTSCDEETALEFLESCGLADVLPEERCFFDVPADRRQETFRVVLGESRTTGADCVLIDDSPTNLSAGKELGLATIGVATTHPAPVIEADVVIDGPLPAPDVHAGGPADG